MAIGILAIFIALIVAPLLLSLVGALRARRSQGSSAGHSPWRWKTTWASALLYALAFNVTFFIQELFLVVPKALTPGLEPVLYHNNHGWEGDHPLAELFQGTGALAILISAALCALMLRSRGTGRPAVTLFLIWMTFHGSIQALLQVVIAAVNPRSDVGRAFAYLGVGVQAQWTAALVALLAIVAVTLGVQRLLLTLADAPGARGARARAQFVARVATVPGVLAILPIIAFRVPREIVEVVMPPIVVTVIGVAWMQAWSWHGSDVRGAGGAESLAVAYPLGAAIALLLVFHVVLRPGIRFF